MEKVIITKVYKSDQTKDGKPLEFKGRDGKSRRATKLAIKTNKHGESWLSALVFNQDDQILNMREGDEVSIVIEERNGFLNFKLPTKIDIIEARVERLEAQFRNMVEMKDKGYIYPENTKPEPFPNEPKDEIVPDDIPF